MTNITDLTLAELVNKVKKKDVSSKEITTAYVDRSEKSKKLNTYITDNFENALKKANDFDNNPNYEIKLPGIPIAVKDLFCTKDVKTTAGSKILNNFIPTYESTVTENLWKEGGILLGKLNCDEFAMGSSNETSFFGNVQSPIGKNLVPGGRVAIQSIVIKDELYDRYRTNEDFIQKYIFPGGFLPSLKSLR